MTHWHQIESTAVLEQLRTDPFLGLSQAEAQLRLSEWGVNQLQECRSNRLWLILWQQFSNVTILILLAAATISALLGDHRDTIAILAIVFLSALLGFNQEYRADKAIAALKRLAVPTVRVLRDGKWQEITAQHLVPGDLVWLEAGETVPADSRLLESNNLQVQEATLTGESQPVAKIATALGADELPLAEQQNMVFMGTTITYGRGRAVVVQTGMNTELGKIVDSLQSVIPGLTPLQRRLDQVGRKLVIVALAIVAVIFMLGLLRREPLQPLLLTAISIAVAAIPEGLPAIVTIALALGAQRMLRQQMLIRHLPAVETLGSVTVICADKTGTLTQNQMAVNRLQVPNPTSATGGIWQEQSFVSGQTQSLGSAMQLLLLGATLCNDALLQTKTAVPQPLDALGDPTEVALVIAAAQMGLEKNSLERQYPRIAELPFASERQRMSTIHQLHANPSISAELKAALELEPAADPAYFSFTKGSVDSLLDISDRIRLQNQVKPLSLEWHEQIRVANNQLAQSGLRVLGVGLRLWDQLPTQAEVEQNLVFLGLVALSDPPRPEVSQAVATCKTAGIRPIMITGDHPLMALAIAQELGITSSDRLLTGADLAALSQESLRNQVKTVSVYARVSPQQKLAIVQALQHQGEIVAMTGDGVNDAPALRQADIGVAMGIMGTDVAKEAADMVLLDDNFATIITAVREGRVIYSNIRKFILYLLSCNSAEIWVVLLAPFLGMPLPLLPLQILWINLLTDGLPALALGLEQAEADIMRYPPRSPQEGLFRGITGKIFWTGLLMGLVTLGVGYRYWAIANPLWQTMLFTILTFAQLANALAMRSERSLLWQIGWFSNKPLLAAVVLTFGLQLVVIYWPTLQEIFQTKALPLSDLGVSLLAGVIILGAVELEKWFWQTKNR